MSAIHPNSRTFTAILTRITAHPDRWLAAAVFAGALILYATTLAPGVVFGDPAEYTFVPHIWGISHPPGYAFQTVLGAVWQRLVPIGSIAYRANLLSAAAGAGIAALVYGAVRTVVPARSTGVVAFAPALLAAGSAATATDIWQHSIHANSHIITALLACASLFALLRWWRQAPSRGSADRWLYVFCLLAGFSITHHPLLTFSFPAYATFILVVRPRVLRDWRTLLRMLGSALLGLSVWAYLPLRASLPVPLRFGPTNVNTVEGFLDLVLARGLRVNLFYFGLSEQPDRWLVFGSLLRLQTGLVIIALMLAGLAWLWRSPRSQPADSPADPPTWPIALLLTVMLGVNLLFILNTIQDVMAYLLTPFSVLMILAGIGAAAVLTATRIGSASETRVLRLALAVTLLAIPLARATWLHPLISLRGYTGAQEWIAEVYDRFEGHGEGAVLLGHWEHLTPLWYEAWVEDHPLSERDVSLVFVATTSSHPWVDNVWANIERGPIYVSGYQRELVEEGFRLRPVGPRLYRVLPPPAVEPPTLARTLDARADPITVVAVDLPLREVAPGQPVPLSIALTLREPTSDIIFPYVMLGDETRYLFTTDSHLLTPAWQPGEIIVERYDLRAPFTLEPGTYPLRLGLRNLSQGGANLHFADGAALLEIGEITIQTPAVIEPPAAEDLIADINHEIGLAAAVAAARGQRRAAPWVEPIAVAPGDTVRIRVIWTALSRPADNYKVFVHLTGPDGRVLAQQDAPPMGGAFPTFLWFPKWVPGQSVVDPYRLIVPLGAPPGEYRIEIGLYGFTTFQRAPFYDPQGNLSGDFFVLGAVRVEP